MITPDKVLETINGNTALKVLTTVAILAGPAYLLSLSVDMLREF